MGETGWNTEDPLTPSAYVFGGNVSVPINENFRVSDLREVLEVGLCVVGLGPISI